MGSARDDDVAVSRRLFGLLLIAAISLAPMTSHAGMRLSMDDPVTLAECDTRVREAPHELESYLCYWIVSRRGASAEAARRLEALLALDPSNQRARLYLGTIEADRYGPRAESLYREAIAGFVADGDVAAEFYSRLALHSLLAYRGRVEEADRELEALISLARTTRDPEHLLGSGLTEAWSALRRARYARAWALYGMLATDHDASMPSWQRFRLLGGLGQTAWALGRLEEAMDYSRRAADLLHEKGNLYAEALQRYYMAEIGWEMMAGARRSPDEALRLAREALEAAVRGENRAAEALARMLRARDPGLDLESRMTQVRTALRIEREVQDVEDTCTGLRIQAALLLEKDPEGNLEAAIERIDDSIARAKKGMSPQSLAMGLASRAAASRRRPGEEIVADYLAAIDTIEKMRDLQWDRLVRARFLWNWASSYYRLAGWLLDPSNGPVGERRHELSFVTIERLRARVSADLLDPARDPRVDGTTGETDEVRAGILELIANVQRRLLSPGLPETERATAMERLARLEIREAEARRRLYRTSPVRSTVVRDRIPALAAVRDSMAGDEALISFHLPPHESWGEYATPTPGPWVMGVTRDRVEVVSLPDVDLIHEHVDLFLGLVSRRDGLEGEAAARLYAELLGDVLDALGGTPRHLILIPDGVLHRLPFGALRREASGPPLAAERVLSIVPSATLWHHWRRSPVRTVGTVLALADPLLPDAGREDSARVGSMARNLHLGLLPGARREAMALARHLGRQSRVLEGEQASEHRLKTADLGRYGVLHFAAHAVVDEVHPQRSAVLLAPGAAEQDGLLQRREIADMDLAGRLVILSTCSSASGELTVGEGVLGLASVFFQSGARAVVAGLWPLRDDDAAELVDRFGRHLGAGRTVAEALALARRDRIRAGAPPAAWAGMVLLGDGDLGLVVSETPARGGAGFATATVLLVLAAGALLATRGIRPRRSTV